MKEASLPLVAQIYAFWDVCQRHLAVARGKPAAFPRRGLSLISANLSEWIVEYMKNRNAVTKSRL